MRGYNRKYSKQFIFDTPTGPEERKLSVWESGPRRAIDITGGEISPFFKMRCEVCHKWLAYHWQLPRRDQLVSKWWCRRDGTAYAYKYHVEV
jgi:hypothetical protein